jgi:hypothetical protein
VVNRPDAGYEGIDDNELDGPAGIDEEPELGWPAMTYQDRTLKSCGQYVTDSGNLHGYGYVHDGGEPSLGSCENINQTSWGAAQAWTTKKSMTGASRNAKMRVRKSIEQLDVSCRLGGGMSN